MIKLIISISGPSSTGKSTLFNKLKKIYPQYTYIEESFRQVVKNKQINLDDPEQGFLFQYELLKYLRPVTNTMCIMDRCGYDHIIYTLLHFLRLNEILQCKYVPLYIQIIIKCRQLLKNINYIFLTQATNNIEDDNIRPTIYNILRDQEINLFSSLIHKINIPCIILPSNTEDRIKLITKYINSY